MHICEIPFTLPHRCLLHIHLLLEARDALEHGEFQNDPLACLVEEAGPLAKQLVQRHELALAEQRLRAGELLVRREVLILVVVEAMGQTQPVLGLARRRRCALPVAVLPLEEEAHVSFLLLHTHQRPLLSVVVHLGALDRFRAVPQSLRVLEDKRKHVRRVIFIRHNAELVQVYGRHIGLSPLAGCSLSGFRCLCASCLVLQPVIHFGKMNSTSN